ncbi:MAG: energy transducer TonB [Thermoanaerobaculales bacterium]
MRIGERKLLQVRKQRWDRAYDALDPFVLELQREESVANRRAARLGVVAAVILHVGLFLIIFPSSEFTIHHVASSPHVYKLEQVNFSPPPKPKAKRKVTSPKARIVPVPDATPDEPEPIEREEADIADFEYPEVGLAVEIPNGPPGPTVGALQIGGNVKAPVRIYAPDPLYPEEARQARVQGAVILQTVIDKQGKVTNVRVLKGLSSGLTEAAVDAVSQWRFNPATLNGEPVAVYYLVTVSFSVQ